MADCPVYQMPVPPVLTTAHPDALGTPAVANIAAGPLGNATSAAWPTANLALYIPFTLTEWATAYQLLWWVGGTSSGNIDVGIYDAQKNRIVSAGSTAMSATTNTVQELNITDTLMAPGRYFLAAACDNNTGTVFRIALGTDEIALSASPIYEQAGLTAAALTNPGVPVVTTLASPLLPIVGIQFRSVF